MGDSISSQRFTRQDRARFREQVQRGLEALEHMLGDGWFEEASQPQLGLEIELNLVDGERNPAMTNEQVLDAIANPAFQTELGRFNVEINVAPRPLGGDSLTELEKVLGSAFAAADERAHSATTRIDAAKPRSGLARSSRAATRATTRKATASAMREAMI